MGSDVKRGERVRMASRWEMSPFIFSWVKMRAICSWVMSCWSTHWTNSWRSIGVLTKKTKRNFGQGKKKKEDAKKKNAKTLKKNKSKKQRQNSAAKVFEWTIGRGKDQFAERSKIGEKDPHSIAIEFQWNSSWKEISINNYSNPSLEITQQYFFSTLFHILLWSLKWSSDRKREVFNNIAQNPWLWW